MNSGNICLVATMLGNLAQGETQTGFILPQTPFHCLVLLSSPFLSCREAWRKHPPGNFNVMITAETQRLLVCVFVYVCLYGLKGCIHYQMG